MQRIRDRATALSRAADAAWPVIHLYDDREMKRKSAVAIANSMSLPETSLPFRGGRVRAVCWAWIKASSKSPMTSMLFPSN
jgi:hypothetical protein